MTGARAGALTATVAAALMAIATVPTTGAYFYDVVTVPFQIEMGIFPVDEEAADCEERPADESGGLERPALLGKHGHKPRSGSDHCDDDSESDKPCEWNMGRDKHGDRDGDRKGHCGHGDRDHGDRDHDEHDRPGNNHERSPEPPEDGIDLGLDREPAVEQPISLLP